NYIFITRSFLRPAVIISKPTLQRKAIDTFDSSVSPTKRFAFGWRDLYAGARQPAGPHYLGIIYVHDLGGDVAPRVLLGMPGGRLAHAQAEVRVLQQGVHLLGQGEVVLLGHQEA